jgi:cbb3-type cytochrome oxidase maturation protein
MSALAWLVPAALVLGTLALVAFLWALNTGQFEDLDGAAWRAIADDEREATRPTSASDTTD